MRNAAIALVAVGLVGCGGGSSARTGNSASSTVAPTTSATPISTAPATSVSLPGTSPPAGPTTTPPAKKKPGTTVLPVPSSPNHALDFGYYYQDGRYGDFSQEVYGYTNLALASPTSYDSAATWGNANPGLDIARLFAKTLGEAHAAGKSVFLMPGAEADWDKTLDVAAPFWSDIKYVQLYHEDAKTDRATAEATTGRFLANVGRRGLKKPLITALESPGAETAANTDVVEIEAYVPMPFNQDDPGNVARLNGIIDARKATVLPGKSMIIVMMAYDRNGQWTNIRTLQTLQFPAYDKAKDDPRVLAITLFSYARPGGTRDHPMLEYAHRLMASAMFKTPVPTAPPDEPGATTPALVGSSFTIAGPAGCVQDSPDLAYDARDDIYLVAAGRGASLGGTFVDADGRLIGQPFELAATPHPGAYYAEFPRVAFSPDTGTFLVAWYVSDGTTTGFQIHARTVRFQNGLPVLGATEVALTTPTAAANGGAEGSGAPVIYNPDAKEFVVAWAQLNADAKGPAGIRLQRVDNTGAPVGAPFTTSDGASEDWPALAYDTSSKEYVLTYGYWGTGAQARGQRFTATGAAVGGPVTLATGSGVWIPQAAYDPALDRYLVVACVDGKTTGQLFSPTLQPAGAPFTIVEGTRDGISLGYDAKSGGFFAILQGSSSSEDYAATISSVGAPSSSIAWTGNPSKLGNFHPRGAYNSKRGEWLAVTSKDMSTALGRRMTSP